MHIPVSIPAYLTVPPKERAGRVRRQRCDAGRKGRKTVYGSPVQTIAVPKTKDGISMTVGDVITSILDFYHYPSIYQLWRSGRGARVSDSFEFTVYAGIPLGIPENFMVLEVIRKDSLIFHRAEWLPENMECVRVMCIYHIQIIEVGTHLERILIIGNYRWKSGDGVCTLQTDAVIEGDGTIVPKEMR